MKRTNYARKWLGYVFLAFLLSVSAGNFMPTWQLLPARFAVELVHIPTASEKISCFRWRLKKTINPFLDTLYTNQFLYAAEEAEKAIAVSLQAQKQVKWNFPWFNFFPSSKRTDNSDETENLKAKDA